MRMPPRLARAAFFTASALGYVLFVVLGTRLDQNARPLWTIDRAKAAREVRAFASEQGFEIAPPPGWWSRWRSERVIGETYDEAMGRYLISHPGRAEEAVRRLVPGLSAHAQLRTPAGDMFEVWLDPEGRRVGYRRSFPEEPPASEALPPEDETGDERAREIAWASLEEKLETPEVIRFQLEDVEENRGLPGPPIYTTTWLGTCDELPELTVRAATEIRGDVVISERLSLDLDRKASNLRTLVATIAFVALLLLALTYSTVRLVRRAREGEVARGRGFVLGATSLVLTGLRPWFVDGALSQNDAFGSILQTAINAAFGALLLAFVWIALEGDVREALPSKLTTLDTLLSGRLLSRDVAWSSLLGIALAGPGLGLLQATRLLPGTGPGTADELAAAFSASAPLPALYVRPGVLWAGIVIFLPLSGLLRWNRSPKRALVQLALLLPALALVLNTLDPEYDVAELGSGVVMAVFLLVPFLYHDFLAALWTMYVLVAAPRILYLYHQPSAALHADSLDAVVLAGLGLTAMLVVLVRGRTYSPEEVRPVYARYLAERLELLAEKKLADEAYDRLLPATLPAVRGATLAASCDRGKAGGSKLYDLFALPQERLGIALIDIEERGAAAALRLALLKGLVRTCGVRASAPFAVLESLHSRLHAPRRETSPCLACLYAIFDPASGTLRFARSGEAPALFLRRPDGEVAAIAGVGAADSELALAQGEALIFASATGVFGAAERATYALTSALAGLADPDATALHLSIRRLAAVAGADEDRTFVVLAAGSGPIRDEGREA